MPSKATTRKATTKTSTRKTANKPTAAAKTAAKPKAQQPPAGAEEFETDVHAQNLLPNCECPLTDGCEGRMRVYHSMGNMPVKDSDGNQIGVETVQYLRCSKCKKTPLNPRRIDQRFLPGHSVEDAPKLFDGYAKKRNG